MLELNAFSFIALMRLKISCPSYSPPKKKEVALTALPCLQYVIP
jgi:hypothetical protein